MSILAPWLAGMLLTLPLGARPISLHVTCGLGQCPSAEVLRRRLTAVLSYDPVSADAARQVAVRFTAHGGGVATDLELREAGAVVGGRRFETPVADWDAIVAATAMNVALIVEPGRLDLLLPADGGSTSAVGADPPPPAPAPPASVPPAATEPDVTPPPRPTPDEPARLGLGLTLAGGGSIGAAPGIAGQLHVGLVGRIDAWSGELGARFTLPASADFTAEGVSGQVVAALIGADAAGCLHMGADGRYAACLTAFGGVQRVGSSGLPGGREATLAAFALGVRGRVEWPLPQWPALRLTAGLDVRAPLWRTTLRVDERVAWQSGFVVLDGLFGAAWIF